MPLDLSLGDVVRLKKPHPCGGTDWQVTRLGADIGLRCLTCNRRLLLERPVLEKRLKQFVSKAANVDVSVLDTSPEVRQDKTYTVSRPSGDGSDLS